MKVRHSKVLFCGSSGIGKTNFINLLLCKDFEKDHIPTRVTKSHQLLATQVTLRKPNSAQCKFECMDYATQIKYLYWFLRNNRVTQNDKDEATIQTVDTPVDKEGKDEHADVRSQLVIIEEAPSFSKSVDKSDNHSQQVTCVENQIAEQVDMPQGDPPDVWNMLTFLDTGGQPEFINMLPAINSSAMITFIMHSMEGGVDSLKDKVTVYGDGPKKYSLDYNYIDLVKMLCSMRKPKESHMFEEFLDTKGDKNCYISLVGTKSDLCKKNSTEVAKDIYKEIGSIIDQTVGKPLLVSVDGKYFIPVSNCRAGKVDEDPVAAKFRDCIYQSLEERDILYIPIVWLILELEIQNRANEEKVIEFVEISNICEKHNLIAKEVDIRTALSFFDYAGIFLYYGSDDDMKNIADIVITNHQWLFENLYQIVKVARSDDDVTEELKYNGCLNKDIIGYIDWKLGKTVSAKYFLKLLEKLAIISPIKRADEYFMPCILPTFPFDASNKITQYGTQDKAEALLMQLVYKESDVESYSYLFPAGVFCCLINLLRMLNYSRFGVQWSEYDSDQNVWDRRVYNNFIVLHDDHSKCYVVLVNRLTHLEIQIRATVNTQIHESVYLDIKHIITSTLESVCDKLKLDISGIRVGFLCSDNKLYWTVKNYHSKDITVYNHNNRARQLTDSQKIWFSGQLYYCWCVNLLDFALHDNTPIINVRNSVRQWW